jgi:hypothetical protein
MRVRLLAPATLGLVLLCASQAQATVVIAETVEEMARGATVVVRGTVGQQQVRWEEGRRKIGTLTEIRVDERIKGEVGSVLLVRQPGGALDGLVYQVAGAAQFRAGDEVVLFLEPLRADPTLFVPRAMAAGKVALVRTRLGEIRALRDLRDLAFYDPAQPPEQVLREVNPHDDLGPAEEFLARVRDAARSGEVGR